MQITHQSLDTQQTSWCICWTLFLAASNYWMLDYFQLSPYAMHIVIKWICNSLVTYRLEEGERDYIQMNRFMDCQGLEFFFFLILFETFTPPLYYIKLIFRLLAPFLFMLVKVLWRSQSWWLSAFVVLAAKHALDLA